MPEIILALFQQLINQQCHPFPSARHSFNFPHAHGVYIIRKNSTVLHVGRSIRGRGKLNQRLKNHLYNTSSFSRVYLNGNGLVLRLPEYTFQYLVVEDHKKRAYLEALAIGRLCPEHIGTGEILEH